MPAAHTVNPNQIILGKARKLWVTDATRAIIATSNDHLRFEMVVRGVDEFVRVTRPYFRFFAGFEFSHEEMKWAFEIVKRSVPDLLPLRRRLAIDEIEKPDTSPLDPDRDIQTDASGYKVRPR